MYILYLKQLSRTLKNSALFIELNSTQGLQAIKQNLLI